jgi:hypothetical protein
VHDQANLPNNDKGLFEQKEQETYNRREPQPGSVLMYARVDGELVVGTRGGHVD